MDGMVVASGRVVHLDENQAPYCMSDGEAQRIGDAARAARTARRDPAEREATTETLLRQKKGDVVAVLAVEGRLSKRQVEAADEILRVFALITRDVQGRVVASYSDREDRGMPSETLPPTLHRAYVERYAPWRAATGRMVVAGAHTLGDLALLFVASNMGPRQVEQQLGMRNGTAVPLLQKALELYAYKAGWVRVPPMFVVRG